MAYNKLIEKKLIYGPKLCILRKI